MLFRSDALPMRTLEHHEFAHDSAWMPSLIELRALSRMQRDKLIGTIENYRKEFGGDFLCALLCSKANCDRIASHLSGIQLAKGRGRQRAWLRFHDPRVQLQIQRILSLGELAALCGPIDIWRICLNGVWHELKCPREGNAPIASLRYTQSHWEALQRVGVVNRALARLGIRDYDAIVEISPVLDELAHRAAVRHGIDRTSDLVEYVCLGAKTHPHFDEHSIVLQAIENEKNTREVGDEDGYVIDALNTIDDTKWQRIKQELQLQNETGTI